MRRINQVVSLIFFVGSVSIVWVSWTMEYYTSLGPGAGFFPVWLGACLAGLSLIWFIQACFENTPMKEDFIPDRTGLIRVGSILSALVIMALLMDVVGFQLMMFVFVFFLLIALGRQNLVLTLIISLVSSFGMYYAFKTWLGVQLPESSIAWLMELGL